MKKFILVTFAFFCMMYTKPTFAMNSEFQKPEEDIDNDVYATPAEEDSGETIDEVVVPEQQPIEQSTPPADEQPVTTTPAATPPANDTTPSTPAPVQQPVQTIEQQPSDVEEQQAEATPQKATQTVTPLTSPSDGKSSDVVIEETNNFWLFAIAGGGILVVILALLFQRLRKNNPYDR